MSLYLGIDPGLSGATALVSGDGRLVIVNDMPLTARGNGRVKHEVDAAALANLLRPRLQEIAHGVVESVEARHGQGVASMFSIGHSPCLGIAFGLLSATKSKRPVELPADKALVLTAARRLWPDAPLDRAKDHSRAEALCRARLAMLRQRGHRCETQRDTRVGGSRP